MYFYYLDVNKPQALIRVRAKRKPVYRGKPYAVHILTSNGFEMPCFPEITFSRLNKLIYIGKTMTKTK